MRTRRATAVAVVLLLATAAACSDADGDSSTGSAEQRQEYVDAIVETADADASLTSEQVTCVAESFVDGFGVDEIVAAEVTTADVRDSGGPGELGLDFSDAQSASFYDRLTGCMDIKSMLIDGMAGGGDLPPEAVSCLDENLSDDLLERYVTTGFTEGEAGFEEAPELEADFAEAISPCMALSGP